MSQRDELVAAIRRAYMLQRARHPEQFEQQKPQYHIPLNKSHSNDNVGTLLADTRQALAIKERLDARAERQLYKAPKVHSPYATRR